MISDQRTNEDEEAYRIRSEGGSPESENNNRDSKVIVVASGMDDDMEALAISLAVKAINTLHNMSFDLPVQSCEDSANELFNAKLKYPFCLSISPRNSMIEKRMPNKKMQIASFITSGFESRYGAPWHCIVSDGHMRFYVRYDADNHIFFAVGGMTIFLFQLHHRKPRPLINRVHRRLSDASIKMEKPRGDLHILSTGMQLHMQRYAIRLTDDALRQFSNEKMIIAHSITTRFEAQYGGNWHCVVSDGHLEYKLNQNNTWGSCVALIQLWAQQNVNKVSASNCRTAFTGFNYLNHVHVVIIMRVHHQKEDHMFFSVRDLTVLLFREEEGPSELTKPHPPHPRKLSASMQLPTNIISSGMNMEMQQYAVNLASKGIAMRFADEKMQIAHLLIHEFEKQFGSRWQCVVGDVRLGFFARHDERCFIYLRVDPFNILLFKPSRLASLSEEPQNDDDEDVASPDAQLDLQDVQTIASGFEDAMENEAKTLAVQAIKRFPNDAMLAAHYIMTRFEALHGSPWHCVVSEGALGYSVHESESSFCYFRIDTVHFFVFQHISPEGAK